MIQSNPIGTEETQCPQCPVTTESPACPQSPAPPECPAFTDFPASTASQEIKETCPATGNCCILMIHFSIPPSSQFLCFSFLFTLGQVCDFLVKYLKIQSIIMRRSLLFSYLISALPSNSSLEDFYDKVMTHNDSVVKLVCCKLDKTNVSVS